MDVASTVTDAPGTPKTKTLRHKPNASCPRKLPDVGRVVVFANGVVGATEIGNVNAVAAIGGIAGDK